MENLKKKILKNKQKKKNRKKMGRKRRNIRNKPRCQPHNHTSQPKSHHA